MSWAPAITLGIESSDSDRTGEGSGFSATACVAACGQHTAVATLLWNVVNVTAIFAYYKNVKPALSLALTRLCGTVRIVSRVRGVK